MTDVEHELKRAISEMSYGQLERFMSGLKADAPMAISAAVTQRLYEIVLYDNHVPVADRKAAWEWLGTVKAIVETGYREKPAAVAAYRAANEHMEDNARLIGIGTLPWLIAEHGVEGAEALIEFVMRPEHEPLLENFYVASGEHGEALREDIERRKRDKATK
jgi:hypothetical protein